ncbi:MAG: ABC transporter permease [Chloroflexota bacterium]|nr:ABC transporter permease [Chloroflexota bacterium]MDE2961892.1 ABC transporter permease [Chloroflexota bacterium]
MTMLPALANGVRWEWFRLRRRPEFWVIMSLLTLAVLGTLLVSAGAVRLIQSDFSIPPYGYPMLVFELLSRLGPFLAIILAGMVFGSDYGWGTFRPLFARGQRRWQVVAAKLVLAVLALAIVWVVSWALAAAVGLVAASPPTNGLELAPGASGSWTESTGRFASAWPATMAYLMLATLLCAVGRSTAFGLGVGIAVLIVESIAYPAAGAISQLAFEVNLGDYTRWTLWGVTRGLMGRDDDLGAWVFLPAVLAYATVFTGLAVVITERRDVNSGNG